MITLLDDLQARAKLCRMAYQVVEQNFDGTNLVIVGIDTRGYFLAEILVSEIRKINNLSVELIKYERPPTPSKNSEIITKQKRILLIDDVLYTGRTLFGALQWVMEHSPERVQVGVLVDRGHRELPVSADFVGLELATTLQNYIEVEIADGGRIEVRLK